MYTKRVDYVIHKANIANEAVRCFAIVSTAQRELLKKYEALQEAYENEKQEQLHFEGRITELEKNYVEIKDSNVWLSKTLSTIKMN